MPPHPPLPLRSLTSIPMTLRSTSTSVSKISYHSLILHPHTSRNQRRTVSSKPKVPRSRAAVHPPNNSSPTPRPYKPNPLSTDTSPPSATTSIHSDDQSENEPPTAMSDFISKALPPHQLLVEAHRAQVISLTPGNVLVFLQQFASQTSASRSRSMSGDRLQALMDRHEINFDTVYGLILVLGKSRAQESKRLAWKLLLAEVELHHLPAVLEVCGTAYRRQSGDEGLGREVVGGALRQLEALAEKGEMIAMLLLGFIELERGRNGVESRRPEKREKARNLFERVIRAADNKKIEAAAKSYAHGTKQTRFETEDEEDDESPGFSAWINERKRNAVPVALICIATCHFFRNEDRTAMEYVTRAALQEDSAMGYCCLGACSTTYESLKHNAEKYLLKAAVSGSAPAWGYLGEIMTKRGQTEGNIEVEKMGEEWSLLHKAAEEQRIPALKEYDKWSRATPLQW